MGLIAILLAVSLQLSEVTVSGEQLAVSGTDYRLITTLTAEDVQILSEKPWQTCCNISPASMCGNEGRVGYRWTLPFGAVRPSKSKCC